MSGDLSDLSRLPPGTLLMLGALVLPLVPARLRSAWLLVLPLLSFVHMQWGVPTGTVVDVHFLGYALQPIRSDGLAHVWGLVYHLAAFVMALYAWHVRDPLQHVAALIYAGSAIAAVFAGDLLTLFVFWEITAVSSVFLIWARRTERAYRAGMRYLIVQVASGVLLLAGTLLYFHDTNSLAFGHLGLGSLATQLIFVAFGIKCAFPLLHNWLQDAYPEATVTGTVFLSAFTTKLAVYALARGFAGVDMLVWIGALMTAFPIFYAVIENDLRRVLAYSLNNQLGFMVVGIGIGTELSLNGTAAHAFAHILYKALLFMTMGAVLHRTGTVKGSEVGGLYRSMPWTAGFCAVGAASISGFPLFSGFISKSLILTAAAEQHRTITYLVLLFASAGVFHHSGIKIPYFAFFSHDSGIRCREAPWNMLLAMGLTAGACIALGVWPAPLYAILPFPVHFDPYTWTHVITQMQLLCFSALAFGSLQLLGLYPPELRSTNLDSDWLHRRLAPSAIRAGERGVRRALAPVARSLDTGGRRLLGRVTHHHVPSGTFARSWPTGSAVLWVTLLLASLLVVYYLEA